MKAWILIGFYLWKDIWSRWLETPGAVLARLVVALLLGSLLFLAQAGFTLGGRSLEHRIARMGAQTLFVSELTTSYNDIGNSSFDQLLAPLRDRAEVLAFRQVPARVNDAFGRDYQLLLYGPATRAALAPLLGTDTTAEAHLVTADLPVGLRVPVTVEDINYQAATVAPPAWLQRIPASRSVLLLPEDAARERLRYGYQEFALIIGHADSDNSSVRPLAQALRNLLRLDGRDQAQVQSPEILLNELDSLRSAQRRWQTGSGLAGGLAVALVFGSIAILEYRQNRFIVALLRSFGVPSGLLLVRYLVEALLLMTVAVLLARLCVAGGHVWIFSRIGFESSLLDRQLIDPYAWSALFIPIRWLYLGAMLSILPIAAVIRQPVGKVLQ